MPWADANFRSGSSPRTQGTRHWRRWRWLSHRFIPAHAGNTHRVAARLVCRSVHPRARREHVSMPEERPARTVHPRARREHGCGFEPACQLPGSSPRTQGTQQQRPRAACPSRFIPAHAGNTFEYCIGNKIRRFIPAHAGNTNGVSLDHPPRRFIPAHAGNTPRCSRRSAAESVHPRARREHDRLGVTQPQCSGSSPRTQGTRVVHSPWHEIERFIPAHAGNTERLMAFRLGRSVHPRARREHAAGANPGSTRAGSSPRTQGTRCRFASGCC